jgi:hypothetical protein
MTSDLRTLGQAVRYKVRIFAVCHNIECRYARDLDVDQLVKLVGVHHPILPEKNVAHFSERLRCPQCQLRGAFVWSPIEINSKGFGDQYTFEVREWTPDNLHFHTIATANSITLVTAAFDAAVKEGAQYRLTVQHGARILLDSHS